MASSIYPTCPRGFVHGKNLPFIPAGYVRSEQIPDLYLHEWTSISFRSSGEFKLAILGHCVSTTDEDVDIAQQLLTSLMRGKDEFFRNLEDLSGRYVVLFGERDEVNFVTDAAGMRSVFYSEDGAVVSSQVHLVIENSVFPREKRPWVIGRGYPGNLVPYQNVRILTPNTYYCQNENKVTRFWPREAIESKTVTESASIVLDALSTTVRGLAKKAPIKSTLTAGSDSRTLLAAVLNSGIDFETYTYGTRNNTLVDRIAASEISKALGVVHTVPPGGDLPFELKKELGSANYTVHHWYNVKGLMDWLDDPTTIILMETLLEIGAGASAVSLPDVLPPVDANSMASLYIRTMPYKKREFVRQNCFAEYKEFAESAFEEWIQLTGGPTPECIDPYVQFFWEHRMATWHGPTMAERDFYASAINPSNSIRVYKTMLGVSREEQKNYAVPLEIMKMVNPKLLDFPFNPKRWPQS